MHMHPYRNLLIMAVASFVAMYLLMYSMVNSISNIYNSLNQAYMAGLMAAPMIVIELLVMRSMYPDKTLNAVALAASVIVAVVFFLGIRQQTAVSNTQFLRSMIPHHASAILMCEEAPLDDTEIKALCGEIVSSQRREIDRMKDKLRRLTQ